MVINLKIETDAAVDRLLPAKIKMEEELYKQKMLNKDKNEPKENEEDNEKDEFPEDPEEFYSEELSEE